MATRTQLGNKIQEGETYLYTTTITDEVGAGIDLTAASSTVLFSLYVKATGVTVNSRNAQSVITAGTPSNEHTGSAAGVMTFKSLAADNPAIAADTPMVLRYQVTYNDGAAVARVGIHEVEITYEDLTALT